MDHSRDAHGIESCSVQPPCFGIKWKWLAGILLLALTVGPFPATAGTDARYHDRPDTAIAPSRYPADYRSPPKPAPEGQAIRKYADDQPGLGPTNFGRAAVHDNPFFYTVRADRLEERSSDETDASVLLWDLQAWAGRDDWRLYLESEGEREQGTEQVEAGQVEVLYGEPWSAFWDWRVGIRRTVEPEPARTFGVLGISGIAPQWLETEANLLAGESGDYRADLELEYNLLFSQRLVFQPRLETEVAFADQPELNLGTGVTGVEVGGRLRYELHRKFAPYVGLSYESPLGETKDIAENNGANPGTTFTVVGVKWWF